MKQFGIKVTVSDLFLVERENLKEEKWYKGSTSHTELQRVISHLQDTQLKYNCSPTIEERKDGLYVQFFPYLKPEKVISYTAPVAKVNPNPAFWCIHLPIQMVTKPDVEELKNVWLSTYFVCLDKNFDIEAALTIADTATLHFEQKFTQTTTL